MIIFIIIIIIIIIIFVIIFIIIIIIIMPNYSMSSLSFIILFSYTIHQCR